jgi:hypothetical protein
MERRYSGEPPVTGHHEWNGPEQWLAAFGLSITLDAARESIASRGSARGTLSAHHKVNTGKDGVHLSLWDFADSLSQLPLIDGHELRHICN